MDHYEAFIVCLLRLADVLLHDPSAALCSQPGPDMVAVRLRSEQSDVLAPLLG